MTTDGVTNRSSSLARILELITIAAMGLLSLAIIFTVIGVNVLGLTSGRVPGNEIMSIPVDLAFPVELGDDLAWTETENGTVDASTGLPPVELTKPVSAQLAFWSPSGIEQSVWVATRLAGPALAVAGAWLIFRMARSTRRGDPFSIENARRLWWLAAIVGIGGTAERWLSDLARAWLIERSAAATLVSSTVDFTTTPIIVGIAIAALASIWHIGVGMREDVEGMV